MKETTTPQKGGVKDQPQKALAGFWSTVEGKDNVEVPWKGINIEKDPNRSVRTPRRFGKGSNGLKPKRNKRLFQSQRDIPDAGSASECKTSVNGLSIGNRSVSLNNLYHTQPFPSQKLEREGGMSETLPNPAPSSLKLPKLEPNVEMEVAADERDQSAYMSLVDEKESEGQPLPPEADEDETDIEELMYQSDEDPEQSLRTLHRIGDYEVQHNWVLQEGLDREMKKFNTKIRKLNIFVPDEDPMESIQNRLSEVSTMVKPKAELGNFIETIDPEQRALIMKVANKDINEIKRERRKNWKHVIDRFRNAAYIVLLLSKAAVARKRYHVEEKQESAVGNTKKLKQSDSQSSNVGKEVFRSSLGIEMRWALCTRPVYRGPQEIKRVTWVLRATRAFKHLFPAELEKEVARVVGYEYYDAHRVMAVQGRVPERFYYILNGKVQKVREYELSTGPVNRLEGVLEKGRTTDPEELEMQWPREYHLVTKVPTEVLIIQRDDFCRLQHTIHGPPIDYLKSLELFREFPCEEFLTSPDSIEFRYFGQEIVIAKDTNRTPWIHVIKSGHVKVVRVQLVVDVNNENKFDVQGTEELGCKKTFSHAGAMLGILATQRKMKTMASISLPEITKRHRPPASECGSVTSTSPKDPTSPRKERKKAKLIKAPVIAEPRRDGIGSRTGSRMDKGHEAYENDDKSKVITDQIENEKRNRESFLPLIITSRGGPPDVVPRENGLHPHSTYITREETEFDPVYSKKPKKETVFRRAYLQLDILKPGDIFGLEHLEPPVLSEAPGYSLISDGAEVIKISKRFFLHHAQNNTMLRVETMHRQYMSTDEAKEILYNKETWNQYKSVLMQRLVSNVASAVPSPR